MREHGGGVYRGGGMNAESLHVAGSEVTRLAPSPTGALHLGNARTFLITWALARRLGWRIILRIEDLDTPRVKAGAAEGLIQTLRWLGIDWDPPTMGPLVDPLVQSADLEPYRSAMRVLAGKGMAYPCELTRAQIEQAASAPQEGAHDVVFDAGLRPPGAGEPLDFDALQAEALCRQGVGANWRFLTPSARDGGSVRLTDRCAGEQELVPARTVGDFVLWTKRDQPSYQLAVVVDDDRQGVTQVVRGDDLLDSAGRQELLRRSLGMRRPLGYWHLPLVLGPDGRRLAKRHGDTRVDEYRRRGVTPEAVIGLLAYWTLDGQAGERRREMSAGEFRDSFDPDTMRRGAVTFSAEDDQWLWAHAR